MRCIFCALFSFQVSFVRSCRQNRHASRKLIHCLFSDFTDEGMFSFPWWNDADDNDIDESDVEFKVIVPRGLILAVRKSDPSHVLWQHTVNAVGYLAKITLSFAINLLIHKVIARPRRACYALGSL